MVLLAGCLAACNQSYPGIWVEEEVTNRPSEEVIKDKVPIMLSMTDPQYSIITRGIGALDDWNKTENRDKWRQMQFSVYAFLDRNHDFKGEPDYSVRTDLNNPGETPFCLVYDRKAKIVGDAEPVMEWVGEVPFYNMEHPDYKYHFFAHYLDDAACSEAQEEHLKDRVVKHIEIDGTQDIITAYARPTKQQIQQIKTDDEFKYIAANWENLIYSTRTGNRGISPVFFLKHEMTRLNFKVEGASPKAESLLVEALSVTTPTTGKLTVAMQPEAGQEPQLGISWDEANRKKVYLATDITPNSFGATFQRETALFNPRIQVGMNETVAVGEILLPAVKSFAIQIEYTVEGKQDLGYHTATYHNVSLQDGEFEKGKSYDVVLKVYGPQQVDLQIGSETMGWVDGGTLPPIEEEY